MNEEDKLGPDERHHSEVPAEGKQSAQPADVQAHAQAPAEGAEDQSKYTGSGPHGKGDEAEK